MTRALALAALLCAGAAYGAEPLPNQGYYQGLSTLYPYKTVYCDKDGGVESACFVSFGDLTGLPKSAPLPTTEEWCVWFSMDVLGKWYQWKPRDVAPDRIKYLGTRVCYFEDKGNPRKLNELEQ